MERAALVFGVILAIGFAVWGLAERTGGVSFRIGGLHEEPIHEVAQGVFSGGRFPGGTVRIRNSAAIVRILPEDRSDITVDIDNPGDVPMPVVSTRDGDVVIDGRLGGRIDDCLDEGGALLDGYGLVAMERLPVITLRTPRRLDLTVDGAVAAEIGALEAADLTFSGCSGGAVGDVAGALDMVLAGSGDVRVGAAQTVEVRIAGAGSVALGAVREALDAVIAGSGNLTAASLEGRLEARSAGSGSAEIQGGRISDADISIAGSGDITVRAPIQRLDASIVGSGDIEVTAPVGDLDVDIAGSGAVRAPTVTGERSLNTIGSGRLEVGN
ncbi:MAG: DUF2807 domain-containing protein [Hyphomonadaceae bacterium]|nr:DUF2807 domain-containing protein [Hyphomonadaceae bacterium]